MPLLTVWSPKGGSGTSVVAAACSLVLARSRATRLADLAGDQPAILGLGTDPELGLADWLSTADAPADALDRLAVGVTGGLTLLPRGAAASPLAPVAAAAAGAALGAHLRDADAPTIADCGTAESAASRALVEVADASIVVVRPCYLALRRAVRLPAVGRAAGVVLVEEVGRSLGAREVADVLGRPIVARVQARDSVARAVDAGVLVARLPEPLTRMATDVLTAVGLLTAADGAAA